uniref:EF-hand domain-containing protein n=1 Tax=Plectus sambesii TaxID=2011161 RepID=A0A914W519_9BILA
MAGGRTPNVYRRLSSPRSRATNSSLAKSATALAPSSPTRPLESSTSWHQNLVELKRSAMSQTGPKDKDQVFWDALLVQNKKSTGPKKKQHHTNSSNNSGSTMDNAALALKFGVDIAEVERVRALFAQIDRDSNGTLTAAEIAEGMKTLGHEVSPKTVQAVMRASDKDGNGQINFEEFLAVVLSKVKLKQEKSSMAKVFAEFDKNGDGVITVDELMAAWETMGSTISLQEATAIIAEADSNGDGRVSFEEFQKMWNNI